MLPVLLLCALMPLRPKFRVRALPSIRPESLSSSFDDESSHIMEHGWPNKLYSDTETDKGLWGTECNHREPNLLNIASNQSHDGKKAFNCDSPKSEVVLTLKFDHRMDHCRSWSNLFSRQETQDNTRSWVRNPGVTQLGRRKYHLLYSSAFLTCATRSWWAKQERLALMNQCMLNTNTCISSWLKMITFLSKT
jgi:hypothetical protein